MTITQNSVDWAAATSEATDILSQYVRIDSSHPRGRTIDTAALFAHHLAREGISYRIYESPAEGKVNLLARLRSDNPQGKQRAFVSNIEQLVDDPGITFDVGWPDAAPATAPWDNPRFQALESACRTHALQAIVTPSLCVGGTDARYFRQLGIPSYDLVPCLFTAEDLKGYHGFDERLSVHNLRLGM